MCHTAGFLCEQGGVVDEVELEFLESGRVRGAGIVLEIEPWAGTDIAVEEGVE